ncbi:hypothetical protein Taro_045986 [Colocasia esculenta]|uniref:Uncharacterized protein n=1 Tax=Colocasia esculenta TaxID=4460 RepID=A0A843WNK7_COLES|nr:hypothetical protein [Colocasia esculenta]
MYSGGMSSILLFASSSSTDGTTASDEVDVGALSITAVEAAGDSTTAGAGSRSSSASPTMASPSTVPSFDQIPTCT